MREICVSAFLVAFELSALASTADPAFPADLIGKDLKVVRGPVNGVFLEWRGKTLAIYGDPRDHPVTADTVLFTHHRRDVVWAGRALVEKGAKAVAPAAEADLFAKTGEFWSRFVQARFHDYAQQTTKILSLPVPVERTVRGGETITWEGVPIRVLDTPGYTRGAVTYVLETEGKVIAFTGDLIYDGGRLLDLYSLQDAIREAKIGGYHGYAARLGQLITSLGKLAAEKPDVLVPARGPVIRNPQEAIEMLVERIRALYANYLSIDALRWYFRDEHILAKAKRVLGPTTPVKWMPMAETAKLPPWVVPIANTRLILSEDKSGFLIDCGSQGIINELKKMRSAGKLASIEHIFITHYHDDHTDQVTAFVKESGATVHACRENWDVLENPAAYRLPAMTANPIHVSGRGTSGSRWRWKEFDLTFYYFPGQTLHHDALFVQKDQGEKLLFIGDSFTPSGIDDYCLLNRNFLHEGKGYFFCLDFLKRTAPDAFLINEHVRPTFRFSPAQLDHMMVVLKKRVELLRPLFPWDDPNFGLDEGWARFYPYGVGARKGETVRLRLQVMNHSPREQVFQARMRLPEGWVVASMTPLKVRVPPRQEGALEVSVAVPEAAEPGLHILTSDVQWGDWVLREWTEAMVTVMR